MRGRFLLLAALCACSSKQDGAIVLGISSDFRAGVDIDRLDAEIDAGAHSSSRTFSLGVDKGQAAFPMELPLEELADGASVSVTLRGFLAPSSFVVERKAATSAVVGQKLLYRVNLEGGCRLASPGSSGGVQPCAVGTCINGTCQDPYVPPSKLEPYDPSWYTVFAGDICKPVGAGPPEVIVGGGHSDYKPMNDDDVAQVEAGPQGGYHVWVAVRLKNLRRSGSQTEISGAFTDLPTKLDGLKVIFTFVPDEGGYCKLYGLRYQLALGTTEVVKPMLGHKLTITAKITDKDGKVGTGVRRVTLSNDIK